MKKMYLHKYTQKDEQTRASYFLFSQIEREQGEARKCGSNSTTELFTIQSEILSIKKSRKRENTQKEKKRKKKKKVFISIL